MALFLVVYNFQLFDSAFQLSELNYLGITRRKNQREFRWNDLSKNLEIISISNGAWRLYRWDIHLVREHLITIALKWRLHWNFFWCSFGDPPFELSQVNVPKVQSYPHLPFFTIYLPLIELSFFVSCYLFGTNISWTIWVTREWTWLVLLR